MNSVHNFVGFPEITSFHWCWSLILAVHLVFILKFTFSVKANGKKLPFFHDHSKVSACSIFLVYFLFSHIIPFEE